MSRAALVAHWDRAERSLLVPRFTRDFAKSFERGPSYAIVERKVKCLGAYLQILLLLLGFWSQPFYLSSGCADNNCFEPVFRSAS